MSGASGQVPAAIHVSPEVVAGGALGKVRDGDRIRVDAVAGRLEALVDPAEWQAREVATLTPEASLSNGHGIGRELFAGMRRNVLSAEEGACTWL
jgi:phosphogluconate dehydratase